MARPINRYKSPPMSKEERWRRHGIIGNYESGGKVDDIPAMLTEGEYVIKKEAAQSLGYNKLDEANQTGIWPSTDARKRSKKNA